MEELDIWLIIMDRGFVKICYCQDPQETAFWLPYYNGKTVRVWGTTKGLAELINGPTSNTILDSIVPEGRIRVGTIIDTIKVEKEKWIKYLSR